MRLLAAVSIGWIFWVGFACWLAANPPEPELMIQAAESRVLTPPPGQEPIALPDPNALFAPCPLMPRNFPQAQKRTA